MKRNLNSFKVSKQALQQYSDVVENDLVMLNMEESIADVWKKNKKAEVAAKELLKALERSQGIIFCYSSSCDVC
jgi:hypothetical protein